MEKVLCVVDTDPTLHVVTLILVIDADLWGWGDICGLIIKVVHIRYFRYKLMEENLKV